jgi:hypothetical protein
MLSGVSLRLPVVADVVGAGKHLKALSVRPSLSRLAGELVGFDVGLVTGAAVFALAGFLCGGS